MGCRGNYVRIELVSSDLQTAAPLGLYDADGQAVTLGANQRLLLAEVTVDAASGSELTTIYAGDGASPVAGERLIAVGEGVEHIHYRGDYQSGHRGIVPRVQAGGAGDVAITGVGYIIEDGSEARPSYREDLSA